VAQDLRVAWNAPPRAPSIHTMLGALTVLLALPLARQAAAEERVDRYIGVARSPSGEQLYREEHEMVEREGKPVRSRTVYYDPQNKVIGHSECQYPLSPYAPNYRFSDLRTGWRESARVDGKVLVLSNGREQRRLDAANGQTLVIGQGLHYFVRQHLDKLARRQVTVRYAVPPKLDTYLFRLRPLDSPRRGVIRLRLEIDNWLLRLLAPELEVDYEVATRRLLRYRGVSNLEDADGAMPQVVIHYSYPAF